MKPTKNRVLCKDCGRKKMLFDTEKKAQNFIRFNNEEIQAESGYSPERSYYCLFCGGWHITSIKREIGLSKNEQMFEQYKQEKDKVSVAKMLNQEETSIRNSSKVEKEEERNEKIKDLENQIKGMIPSQKENFFLENISNLNKEIEQLCYSHTNTDKEKLKGLRQNLEILYILRKRNGFQKNSSKIDETKEKELEEWRLWAKKIGY
jgi:hypothetical protein